MTHPENLSKLTLIGIEAALNAGDLLKKGFGTKFEVSSKPGKMNLVTEYDRKSEKCIVDFIQDNVPSSCFLAEEGGKSGNPHSENLWIVDPLDGTVNFAHRIPFFSISIAAYQHDRILCGIVYHPLTSELFVAERNHGAYLNGDRIHVSSTRSLSDSILATGFPYNLIENPSHCIERFSKVLRLGIPVRRLGSAALDLAYTAAGRFDGFFEPCLKPWDIAAGNLLIEEAGGKISSWENKKYNVLQPEPLLATNGLIHNELSEILSKKP